MLSFVAVSLVATSLTLYPALGDRPAGHPRPGSEALRIEAMIDKGPIVELIVACRKGTAILSYSKVERLFCGPGGGCSREAASIAARACR